MIKQITRKEYDKLKKWHKSGQSVKTSTPFIGVDGKPYLCSTIGRSATKEITLFEHDLERRAERAIEKGLEQISLL